MTTKFVQVGDVMNYTAGADIAAGDVVVLKHGLGVALANIANGATGAVAIEGVFVVPKVSGAVFVQGEKLKWIAATANFDDSAAVVAEGDITGAAIAMVAGANLETTATVKLIPGNTVLTPP
jgi:predicted RecA/RadA family phage recombinase